jgi:uncharacterized protein DUF1360
VAVLATWRLTHLLSSEDGPADVIVRVRALLGRSLAGRLMDCFYCLSLWIAAPMAFFVCRAPSERLATWLAVSGAACLLERIGQQRAAVPAIAEERREREEREKREEGKVVVDGMLWTETRRAADVEPAREADAVECIGAIDDRAGRSAAGPAGQRTRSRAAVREEVPLSPLLKRRQNRH